VAISKPTVIKYLKRLEDKGIIRRKDGKIKIIKEGIFVETQPTDIAVMRNYYPEALDEDDFDSNGNFIKSYGY
jgi:DNA-binding Lrp family transcriptional regulator